VAFAATRAVGHAAQRHRHVRKLREFYRLNKGFFHESGHFFLLVRSPINDWPEFEARLKQALSSLTMTKP
jgi:RNase P protein component